MRLAHSLGLLSLLICLCATAGCANPWNRIEPCPSGGGRFEPTEEATIRVYAEGERPQRPHLDGKQHYADGDRAIPARYAELVAADRQLRLVGYEVYRFGGAELQGEQGKALVETFFSDLLKKHGVGS